MPAEIVDRIVAAQNYLAAYANVRQLSFGMTDMAWHTLTEPFEGDVEQFEAVSMAPTQVLPVVPERRWLRPSATSSGGYAAGYYGYKWAEVLRGRRCLFKEKGHLQPRGGFVVPARTSSRRAARSIRWNLRAFPRPQAETRALIEKRWVWENKRSVHRFRRRACPGPPLSYPGTGTGCRSGSDIRIFGAAGDGASVPPRRARFCFATVRFFVSCDLGREFFLLTTSMLEKSNAALIEGDPCAYSATFESGFAADGHAEHRPRGRLQEGCAARCRSPSAKPARCARGCTLARPGGGAGGYGQSCRSSSSSSNSPRCSKPITRFWNAISPLCARWRQTPTTEFATATNSLPAEFYGKYDNLNRFQLPSNGFTSTKWATPRREDLRARLPAELRRNCRVCPVGAVGRDDLPDLRRQQFQALAQRPARLPGDAPDFAGERSRAPGRTLRHARRRWRRWRSRGSSRTATRSSSIFRTSTSSRRTAMSRPAATPGREHRNVSR